MHERGQRAVCGRDARAPKNVEHAPQRHRGHREEGFQQHHGEIIGEAIEVHWGLGPGLWESPYEQGLRHVWTLRPILFERQKPLPVEETAANSMVVIESMGWYQGCVVVEIEAVGAIRPLHEAQLLTRRKFGGCRWGCL
jgi:GxxExxY protein